MQSSRLPGRLRSGLGTTPISATQQTRPAPHQASAAVFPRAYYPLPDPWAVAELHPLKKGPTVLVLHEVKQEMNKRRRGCSFMLLVVVAPCIHSSRSAFVGPSPAPPASWQVGPRGRVAPPPRLLSARKHAMRLIKKAPAGTRCGSDGGGAGWPRADPPRPRVPAGAVRGRGLAVFSRTQHHAARSRARLPAGSRYCSAQAVLGGHTPRARARQRAL